jgi:MFS family permease
MRTLMAVTVAAFGCFGLLAGCYAVVLVDLIQELEVSPGTLGVVLFLGSAASIGSMVGLGWMFDRPRRALFLAIAACAWGAGMAGFALAGSVPAFIAAQVLFNSAGGLYYVGINAVAVDVERLSGRRLMSYLHAAYSAGAVLGATPPGRCWKRAWSTDRCTWPSSCSRLR